MKKAAFLSVTACALLTFILAAAPETDDYFESDFDGVWAGYADAVAEGVKTKIPLVLNFNALGDSGEGFVVLLDYYTGDFLGNKVLTLTNVTVKGKKLTFSVDVGEPDIGTADYETNIFKFTLKKKTGGELKGKYTSGFKENPKGRATLYPMDDTKPLQGVWFWQHTNGNLLYYLQLVQNSPVSGFVFVHAALGPIDNGDFTGNSLTGSFSFNGMTYDIDMTFSAAKKRLRGTISAGGGQAISMFPLGTTGKKIKVKSVTPNEAVAGAPGRAAPGAATMLTIKGKNFAEGAMVHFDNPDMEVCCVQFVSAKELRVNVIIPSSVAAGTTVGVRVVNPDNRISDKANALTVSDGGGGGGGTTVSFAADIQPVFNDNCVVCHGAGGSAGLDLRQGAAYGNIVNVAGTQIPSLFLIEQGDPDNSYLIRKLKGQGISGSRMPLGGPFLSQTIITRFENWTAEGALNN